MSTTTLVDRIDALLPQTQCTQCGYAGCRPYAEAIAAGAAGINQCPPGGDAGIGRLAALLQRQVLPLDPAHGVEKPLHVAVIDEPLCIGCTLCIQACPVDAIVGASKLMHTVLAGACTGCGLCVPPCPMDCIAMVPVAPARGWTTADADAARARFEARRRRLAREQARHDDRLAARGLAIQGEADEPAADRSPAEVAARSAALEAAIARARRRRADSRQSS
jgi:electron transport complex protein RnfB